MKEKIVKLLKYVFSKEFIIQVIMFGIAGGTTSIIDWGVLAICVKVFHLAPMLGNVLSFFCSAPYNYWANDKFVFKFNNEKGRKRVFVTFVALAFVGFLINQITMYVGNSILQFNPLLVKIAGIALAAIFNFLSRKLILEKRIKEEPAEQ